MRHYNAIRYAVAFCGKSSRLSILSRLSNELYLKTIKGADLSSSQRITVNLTSIFGELEAAMDMQFLAAGITFAAS